MNDKVLFDKTESLQKVGVLRFPTQSGYQISSEFQHFLNYVHNFIVTISLTISRSKNFIDVEHETVELRLATKRMKIIAE